MQSDWDDSLNFDEGLGTGWNNDANTLPDLQTYAGGPPKFHRLLFIFALVGAALGTTAGLILFDRIYDPNGSNIWQVGLVLAIICGLVLFACVLCELLHPRITVNHEIKASSFLIVLLAAALVFAAGCLFEFLYEIGGVLAPVEFNDFVFAIDDSGSMEGTDSNFLRYSALDSLLDTMDEDKRVGVLHFTDKIEGEPVPIDYLTAAQRSELKTDLSDAKSEGGTDIQEALETALQMYEQDGIGNRLPVVVLLSDGGSSVLVSKIAGDYLNAGVAITTVSLGQGADSGLLQDLAQATGGQYIDVENAEELIAAFAHVSTAVARRCLFTSRPGPQRNSILYMILRVVFLAVPALLTAFALVMAFKEKGVERQLLVSGITGVLAGLVMEFGTYMFLPPDSVRLFSWMLYGIVVLTYIAYNSGIRQTELEDRIIETNPDAFEQAYNKAGQEQTLRNAGEQTEKQVTRGDDEWGF